VPSRLRQLAAAALGAAVIAVASAPAVAGRVPGGRPGRGQLQVTVPKDPPASIEFRLAPAGDPGPLSRTPWGRSPGRYKWGQLQVTVPEDVLPSRPGPRPKKGRAWIEWGVFVAGITVQYWLSASFPEDADYRLTLGDQLNRIFFLDAFRFDSNQFSLNWSHISGAAMYYQFGRTNHLPWTYCYLMSFAGSTWWEVIGEPKEVISINDMIVTGLGGLAVGEPWYQFGKFFLHQRTFFPRVLSFLNPVLRINHALDHKDPATRAYIQPGWHDISFLAGARRLSGAGTAPGTDLYFGFQGQLILPPEYGRPGEVRRSLKDTYFSEISVDYAFRNGHAEETRWSAKAVPLGLFDQKIGPDGNGYSLMVGLGSAFEYFKKRPIADYDAVPVPVKTDLDRLHLEEPRSFTDKLALLHIAGPVLDLTVFRRGLRLRTVLEGYVDFGLVNATALNDYSVTRSIEGLQTIVFYYGYFYGFGGSGAASFSLNYKGIEARGRAELGAWGSADSLHRFQSEFTHNAHLADTRVLYRGGISWTVPRTSVKLFFDLERVRRWGRLEEVRTTRVETKLYAGLAFCL